MSRRYLVRRFAIVGAVALIVGLLPPAGAEQGAVVPQRLLSRLSSSVVFHYWMAHPSAAPAGFGQRTQAALAASRATNVPRSTLTTLSNRLNNDGTGLPQNEESIALCPTNVDYLVGGTNDYRGLLDPAGNFTGWHLTKDGGASVANEGLLPPVDMAGVLVPSGGDPVDVIDRSCNVYAGSLNYDPNDPFGNINGIGVYKSSVTTLASCPGGSDPICWPARRAIVTSAPNHFLDKEWMDAGASGTAGQVVWVTYTDFTITGPGPLDFTASIFAIRCDKTLTTCTAPILISGSDEDVQFSDVTIAPDGQTYVSWSEIQGELTREPQTFIHKIRVAPAGSTLFGPTHVIYSEDKALSFDGVLHANDFRIGTQLKTAVRTVSGHQRIFATWDACTTRLFDTSCVEPLIKLRTSDDGGATWSAVKKLSASGDNYFPTIDSDPLSSRIVVAYYTNRFDRDFHNRQDVELVSLDPSTLAIQTRRRVTGASNETESDPLLGGVFIGDYFEVTAFAGQAYVHFNANYVWMSILGSSVHVNQQDNFLRVVSLS